MNRDTRIGVLGAFILITAMIGVFTYERSVALAVGIGPEETGAATTTLAGPAISGTTPVGDHSEETLTIATAGLTNVTFTLTWTAENGRDTLQLVVTPPGESAQATQSEPEDDGEIALRVPVANPAADGTLGTGDWRVTIAFLSASTGAPVEPPVAPPAGTDAQVDWALATTLEAWRTD